MSGGPRSEDSPSSASSERLARECRSFAWALVGDVPTDAVLSAYERAHRRAPLDQPGSTIDRVLTRVASAHPWLARLADAYAAMFVRRGLFRTKLVVLLAMLESAPPHHWRFERDSVSPVRAWARLVFSGSAAVLVLVMGVLLFGLPHLVTAPFDQRAVPPPTRTS